MKLRKTNKKGFTLVELIVVIAIIAIIAAIAIPTTIVYVGRANDSSAQSEADSVVRTIRESITSAVMTKDTLNAGYFKDELKEQMGSVQYANKVTISYDDANKKVTIKVETSRGDIGAEVGVDVSAYEISFDKVASTIEYGDTGWTVTAGETGEEQTP